MVGQIGLNGLKKTINLNLTQSKALNKILIQPNTTHQATNSPKVSSWWV